jgi:malate synthase
MNQPDLTIDPDLRSFVEQEALAGTGIDADRFWSGLAGLVEWFEPINRRLLAVRDRLQEEIDDRHRREAGRPLDPASEPPVLERIGYMEPPLL